MMIGAVALGLVFLAVGNNLSTTEITLRALIAVIAMAAIVMLSEPLKKFLQERADRFFYGKRYDLRQGLLDFGRTLSATTAMEPLLDALTERLKQVLDVEKVAVFIEDEKSTGHYQTRQIGRLERRRIKIPADFRQMIRQKSAEKGDRPRRRIRTDRDRARSITNGNGNRQRASSGRSCIILFRASSRQRWSPLSGWAAQATARCFRPKISRF